MTLWCDKCGMPVRKKGDLYIHTDSPKPIRRVGYVVPHVPVIILGGKP